MEWLDAFRSHAVALPNLAKFAIVMAIRGVRHARHNLHWTPLLVRSIMRAGFKGMWVNVRLRRDGDWRVCSQALIG